MIYPYLSTEKPFPGKSLFAYFLQKAEKLCYNKVIEMPLKAGFKSERLNGIKYHITGFRGATYI